MRDPSRRCPTSASEPRARARPILRWPACLALASVVGACTGPFYSIDALNMNSANQRAARYCGERGATARLEQIQRQGGNAIESYQCIAEPAP